MAANLVWLCLLLAGGLLGAAVLGRSVLGRHRARARSGAGGRHVSRDPKLAAFLVAGLTDLVHGRVERGLPVPDLQVVFVAAERLVVHFARPPAEPPSVPWRSEVDGQAWVLDAADLRRWQRAALPFPALVTLGAADGWSVLVDLEQAPGLICLAGEPLQARRVLAAIAFELATGPWSASEVDVTMVGFDPGDAVTLPAPARVRQVAGLAEALAGIEPAARRAGLRLGRLDTPNLAGGRLLDDPAPLRAHVLLLAEPPAEADVDRVTRLVGDAHCPVVIACLGESRYARWRFAITPDGRLDLGPLGLRLRPIVAAVEEHQRQLGSADVETQDGYADPVTQLWLAEPATVRAVPAGPSPAAAAVRAVPAPAAVPETAAPPAAAPPAAVPPAGPAAWPDKAATPAVRPEPAGWVPPPSGAFGAAHPPAVRAPAATPTAAAAPGGGVLTARAPEAAGAVPVGASSAGSPSPVPPADAAWAGSTGVPWPLAVGAAIEPAVNVGGLNGRAAVRPGEPAPAPAATAATATGATAATSPERPTMTSGATAVAPAAGPAPAATGAAVPEAWRAAVRELTHPVVTGEELDRHWPAAVEIRLLGPVEVRAPGPVTAAALPLLTELAVTAGVHPDGLPAAAVPELLAGTGAPDADPAAVLRALAHWLGADPTGRPRLRERPGGWALPADVRVDWHLFRELVAAAEPANERARLVTALALIRGAAWSGQPLGRHARQAIQLGTDGVAAIVPAACRRAAELAWQAGDVGNAEWSLRRGLALLPAAESLWRQLLTLRAEHQPDSVADLADEMLGTLDRPDGAAGLAPETTALLARLASPAAARLA